MINAAKFTPFLVYSLALLAIQASSQPFACDDDTTRRFYTKIGSTDIEKHSEPCVWLAARPQEQAAFCAPDHFSLAFFICRETCGACSDDCEDTADGSFMYNGFVRDCLWLSLRNWVQDEVCGDPTSNAATACPETCHVCDTPMALTQTDVIVIGAGAAGIGAASRIADVDSSLDVTILESTMRIGGRVRTVFDAGVEGNKVTIENGANWVYEENPIREKVDELNMRVTFVDIFDFFMYTYSGCDGLEEGGMRRKLHQERLSDLLDGLEESEVAHNNKNMKTLIRRFLRGLADDECVSTLVSSEEVVASYDIFYEGPANCTGTAADALWCEEVDKNGDPLVIDYGILAQYLECGWNSTDTLQYFWKWFFHDYDFAEEDGSLYNWFDSFAEFQYFFSDQRGFESVIEALATDADVEPIFDQRVFQIKYDYFNGDYRALVYAGSTSGEVTVYETQRVISTIPAEVLNLDLVKFEPALRYSAAMFNPMRVANYVKIFYQFENKFWDDAEFIFTLNDEPGSNDRTSFMWQSLDYTTGIPGSKMLFHTVLTEAFEDLVGPENVYNAEIPAEKLESLLEPLRYTYPETFEMPIFTYYNQYHSDMNTGYGAYTQWQVGFDPWDYYAFYGAENATNYYIQAPCEHNGCNGEPEAEATEWVLYLSGTASCLEFSELVHGGWYSGEVAANNMLESLGYDNETMGFWYDICYYGLNETLEALYGEDE